MALSAGPLAAAVIPCQADQAAPASEIIDRAERLEIDIDRGGDCSLGIRRYFADEDNQRETATSEIVPLIGKLLADFQRRPSLPEAPQIEEDARLTDAEILARTDRIEITIYRDAPCGSLFAHVDVGLGIFNIFECEGSDLIRRLLDAFQRKPI